MACESLERMLGTGKLRGKRFLDVGSGSGLFSLAAMRLGAASVYSFDFDSDSVACTSELRRRFYPEDPRWTVCQGDLLDDQFTTMLSRFDIVYCWGVAHHTGDMWRAAGRLARLVEPGGVLFTALYNDQGWMSRFWRRVKRLYCSGRPQRIFVLLMFIPLLVGMGVISDLLHGRSLLTRYRRPHARGMSTFRDWFDWLGGYPFEVARAEEVLRSSETSGSRFASSRRSAEAGVATSSCSTARSALLTGAKCSSLEPRPRLRRGTLDSSKDVLAWPWGYGWQERHSPFCLTFCSLACSE